MPFTVLKGADGVQFHPPLYLQLLYYMLYETDYRVDGELRLRV